MSLKPILIGIPGVGKTTLSKALGELLSLKVVSTDSIFRKIRSIPLEAVSEEGHEVVVRFLERTKTEFPEAHARLTEAARANEKDPRQRSFLSDGSFFRRFGEDVFRTFEIVLNTWLSNTGQFDKAIVDLSGTAPLYGENRELFSKDYFVVLLSASRETLGERLLRDYSEHLHRRTVIRGRYENYVESIQKKSNTYCQESAHKALLELSDRDRLERESTYRQWANIELSIDSESSPQDFAEQILEEMSKHQNLYRDRT